MADYNSTKPIDANNQNLPHLPEKLARLTNMIDNPKDLVNQLLGD